LKRVDAARVVVDESVPDGTLLSDLTMRSLLLSLRVIEGMKAPLEPTEDLGTAKFEASSTSAILNVISNTRQALSSDSVRVHKDESGPFTSDSKLVRDTSRRLGFYIVISPAHNPADRKPALSEP